MVSDKCVYSCILAVIDGADIWCSSLRDNHFCATKIAEPKNIIILFGLVEMFLLAKGTNPQEEIFLGSKLTEIFFLTKVKLARSKYAY